MGKSVSEIKVNKEAQGAVDQAESKIKKAKNFFGGIKSKLEKERTPDDGKIAKAEKFVGEMEQGNDSGSGGGGLLKKIGDGALGLVLGLPLLFSKSNENQDVDVAQEYEGDEKELKKEVQEEQKLKDDGLKEVKEVQESGKKISDQKIKQIKEVKQQEKVEQQQEPQPEEELKQEETKEDVEKEAEKPETEESDKAEDTKKEELEDVVVSGESAQKFELAVEALRERLSANKIKKSGPDVEAAAKSVESNPIDKIKTANQEKTEERTQIEQQILALAKERKRVIDIEGRDSEEFDVIDAKFKKARSDLKNLKKASKGGIIQGPQSGYPVSMDGESVDFIGHGTEEVRTKEDGSGAFIVPIDTPDTRKDPKLMERRQKEADAMGFKGFSAGGLLGLKGKEYTYSGGFLRSFSAGGLNADKVFGQAPIDKDSELYKYSDIDKFHENVDLSLNQESTTTGEDGVTTVKSKSSLLTPKEQYEYLANHPLIGEANIMQLVDGTYMPNVAKLMAESWPKTVSIVEKYLEEGAEMVKEQSGISVSKEVKQALKMFKKTFKDFERFKDRKTGEYDIAAMTDHLNSFIPGTIPYAKVQMAAAKRQEKRQEMIERSREMSKGGFLKIDGLKPYSSGGVLESIMKYFGKGRKSKSTPPQEPMLIPMPTPQGKGGGTPMMSTPPPPPESLPPMMGPTDQEVMASFLLTELGKS